MLLSGKIAVDANAILSALIGGKASRVFIEAKDVEFITTANVVDEVVEYIPVLARKKGLERATAGYYGSCIFLVGLDGGSERDI